ncbi:MAG: glycosyltransferase family 4 protein [Candidatus Zixiibacteriota bacterium]
MLWIKSDFPLPADTGGKIRTRHLLTELAKRAEVTFLCYVTPELDPGYMAELRGYGVKVESIVRPEENKQGIGFYLRVLAKLLSPRPYIVNKYISQEMIEKVRVLATPEKCDVVICDFLEMAWCREYVSGVSTALFEHNVETMIWRRYHEVEVNPLKRLYFGYEKQRLERFEALACSTFDTVLTVSEQDGAQLKGEFGLRNFTVLPTGVDVEYFRPQPGEVKNRLVFCGSMDWMANIDGFWWFYQSIYPLIKAGVADVSFAVVGRRPGDDIRAVAANDAGVTVTGTVDDVRSYVAGGQLYIVPLRVGGGTRIKIYEAMAMKKCVVATSIGAEGLPLAAGEHIVIADGEAPFAESIKELLRDDNKRNKIAEAGYRLVTGNFGWSRSAEILYDALQSVRDAHAGKATLRG